MSRLPIRGLEAATHPNRLYPVLTHEVYGFYAGRAADSRQVLAAVAAAPPRDKRSPKL